jgi:hypothetical protein
MQAYDFGGRGDLNDEGSTVLKTFAQESRATPQVDDLS